MYDHFISVYFNPSKFARRKELCQEFINKYPRIYLIQVAYDKDLPEIKSSKGEVVRMPLNYDYQIYRLVNKYINENKSSINSITIIDTDLIFSEKIFNGVITKPSECATVTQGYSSVFERLLNGEILDKQIKGAYCNGIGNTGLILSYNRAFLLKINWSFPDYFIYGGFDFFLYLCLKGFRRSVENLVDNEEMTKKMLEFYDSVQGTKMDFVNQIIIHNYHGNRQTRTSNLLRYSDLSNTKDYFDAKDII